MEKEEQLRPCPFCGEEAEFSSEYDSDDNRPDGYRFFVQCKSCGGKGPEFYTVTINNSRLTPLQRIQQERDNDDAWKQAKDAWNRSNMKKDKIKHYEMTYGEQYEICNMIETKFYSEVPNYHHLHDIASPLASEIRNYISEKVNNHYEGLVVDMQIEYNKCEKLLDKIFKIER